MSEILVLWLLFTVLPLISGIGVAMIGVTFIIVVLAPIASISVDVHPIDGLKSLWKFVSKKSVWITYFLILTVSFLTPNTQQMKYIIGGYFAYNSAEYIGDIKGADKLPENIVNAVNSYLEKTKK